MKTIPFSLDLFKAGAKVVTRDGREVKQLTVFENQHSEFKIYGVLNDYVNCWLINGRYMLAQEEHKSDLLIQLEPKLRAWRPCEVPVGALIRTKGMPETRMVILGMDSSVKHLQYSGGGNSIMIEPFSEALSDREYKWPQEPDSAWRACGVEE